MPQPAEQGNVHTKKPSLLMNILQEEQFHVESFRATVIYECLIGTSLSPVVFKTLGSGVDQYFVH